VRGDTDAAAENHAVHQGHDRLRVAGDVRVHPVLVLPEDLLGRAGLHVFVDGDDVAARAEAPLPRTRDEDGGDAVVRFPVSKGRRNGRDHVVVEGVDRFGPVQEDVPDAAAALQQNLVRVHRHSLTCP
jgi:hypothetical protein